VDDQQKKKNPKPKLKKSKKECDNYTHLIDVYQARKRHIGLDPHDMRLLVIQCHIVSWFSGD
jgi:predicted metal-dependent HD superfamily phosphohydrolase